MAAFLFDKCPNTCDCLNLQGFSPLYLAIKAQFWDLVRAMLSHHHPTDEAEAVARLIKGKSVVHAAIVAHRKEKRKNPLITALVRKLQTTYKKRCSRLADMLKIILKSHRDLIKCTDEEGLTPLSYAAYKGFVDIVEYIITEFPRSVRHYKNDDRSEPIHKACLGGHVQVLQKLICKSSKSLKSEAELGRTVLHLAAKEPRNKLKHVVSYLLDLNEGKELLNKEDEYGSTPLDLAKTNNNTEVEQLIQKCYSQME